MTPVERVVALCKEKGTTIAKIERDLGFSNGYIRGLKGGKISAERVRMIGDYLGVPYYEIDDDIFPKQDQQYYLNPETAQMAQELFDNPNMRILFDAARDCKPEDLQMAAEMLSRFKKTNPDG